MGIFVKQVGRIGLTSNVSVIKFVLESNHGLMFHARIWDSGNANFFLNPWIFAEIFFQHPGIPFLQLNDFFSLSGVFLQNIILYWNYISIDCFIIFANHFIFAYIKENAIITDGIICFPMECFLFFFGLYVYQKTRTSDH